MACEKCNVWQHSACLGISQAEAEKDDFHFICGDCKRREEDAKKPKIPALKFRLGSSSSPPSDKTIRVNGIANEPKKRESEDGHARLPPMRKFSHVYVQADAVNPLGRGQPQAGLNGMHGGLMNGPTLSPHGQLPPPQYQNGHVIHGAPPPPGLASPPRPAAYGNGYTQHASQQNGYASQPGPPSNPALSTTPSAATHSGYGSPGSAWLAQSPPFRSVQQPQNHHQLPPQPLNPFLNSFDRQRPSSSHSTNNLPSPTKNRPTMSSPQSDLETSAIVSAASQPNNNLHTEFYPPGVIHTPRFSPTKQFSSPAAPMQVLSSSPLVLPPIQQQQNRQSSLGLSPMKHSPPRPQSDHSIADTPVVPPVADLSPSPRQQQNFHAPVKSLTPERPREVNGSHEAH